VARFGEVRNVLRFLVGEPERNDYLEDMSEDGEIILKFILNK
jgi:hypothetical protein